MRPSYTVVYTGRVHGRLRAVYTSTRAVYTASCTASTRPSTHVAVYTALVHNLHGAGLSCVHGPCLWPCSGRTHQTTGHVHGRYNVNTRSLSLYVVALGENIKT